MSRDYRLNKSELTALMRQLKLYNQYLPVLMLKREQLQLEYNRINQAIKREHTEQERRFFALKPLVKFFSDSFGVKISDVIAIEKITTKPKSVAGISVMALESVEFKPMQLP